MSTISNVSRVTFRAAFAGEEEKLLKIERACFQFPWSRDDFQSDYRLTVVCDAFAADDVFGYLATRRWGGAVIIESVAVAPEFQRLGIGRAMVDAAAPLVPVIGALNKRRTAPPKYVEAWVWERNLGAQLFFRDCGFKAVKTVPHFFNPDDVGEDAAILFSRPIDERFQL